VQANRLTAKYNTAFGKRSGQFSLAMPTGEKLRDRDTCFCSFHVGTPFAILFYLEHLMSFSYSGVTALKPNDFRAILKVQDTVATEPASPLIPSTWILHRLLAVSSSIG